MQLTNARRRVAGIVELLAPACERIEVAGSIRRGKADVKDAEVVAIGKPYGGRPVFGEPRSALPPLEAAVKRLVALGELDYDREVKRDGPKYKRLVIPAGALRERLILDLFIVSADTFGLQMALRTGDADFSRALVTPREAGGLLPDGMFVREGALWEPWDGEPGRVYCPDEPSFFAAIGLPRGIPPERRDRRLALRLARRHPDPLAAAS